MIGFTLIASFLALSGFILGHRRGYRLGHARGWEVSRQLEQTRRLEVEKRLRVRAS